MKRSERHIKKPEDAGEHFLRGGVGPNDKDHAPLTPGGLLDYRFDPDEEE